MANNNVQAQETESLNIREAFFLKYKKANYHCSSSYHCYHCRCIRLCISDLRSS